MEMIENRMVNDSVWRRLEKESYVREKSNGPGWKEIGTGIFVPEKEAFEYALGIVLQDEEGLKQEFVEWFYSGNWIKEYQENVEEL